MLGALTSASVHRDLIGWRKLDHWYTRKFEGVEHFVPIWKIGYIRVSQMA